MSTKVAIGQAIPDFEAAATGEQSVKLSALRGKKIVLYFYPKDATPGCTTEGQNFRDAQAQFKKANAVILGVSRDSVKSHEKFKETECFPFDLLSDPEEQLCNLFDVMKMKNKYGKMVRGVERSTFLIDEKGVLRKEWRAVKVDRHVAEVLEAVKAL
jgi:thioredoxin-dependent peroxiredoxin